MLTPLSDTPPSAQIILIVADAVSESARMVSKRVICGAGDVQRSVLSATYRASK
jgi:hypothetical protein